MLFLLWYNIFHDHVSLQRRYASCRLYTLIRYKLPPRLTHAIPSWIILVKVKYKLMDKDTFLFVNERCRFNQLVKAVTLVLSNQILSECLRNGYSGSSIPRAARRAR